MPKRPDPLLTTAEAAARLGIKRRQVQAYIATGALRAERVGRAWVLRESDVQNFTRRPRGNFTGKPRRPKKEAP
jgi:excisionase family DNA binding protein